MTGIYKDILLLVLGLMGGIFVKGLIEPLIEARSRKAARKENWLEDAIRHAEEIQTHIQSTRTAVTSALGFDGEKISAAIVQGLTPEYGPSRIEDNVKHLESDALKKRVGEIKNAFMAVRMAAMDIEHGAEPASEEYAPTFATQWYDTSLSNFVSEAREMLTN
jgi:hypothetical protein